MTLTTALVRRLAETEGPIAQNVNETIERLTDREVEGLARDLLARAVDHRQQTSGARTRGICAVCREPRNALSLHRADRTTRRICVRCIRAGRDLQEAA